MHTTKFEKNPEYTFHHNGNFSGNVTIVRERYRDGPSLVSTDEVEVPFDALVSLVAKWARDVRLAKLEDATEREVLGLPK
jgi:hypothetical protein